MERDMYGNIKDHDIAFRHGLSHLVHAFKDDDPDTMIRRLEALEHYILRGANEVTD